MIGQPEDPYAIWLTDYESPVEWSLWGTFQPAVVSRGTVTCKIGLEPTALDITWSPKIPRTFGVTTATANPMQLAQIGFYDNWPVRVWLVFMPTPGDANTLGTCELFGGKVGSISVDRTGIKFNVNSLLYVVNQDVPQNTVEMTNTLASFLGAQPPAGFAQVPRFDVSTGIAQSTTKIYADCTNFAGMTWPLNTFQNGFMIFDSGTLEGFWSAIGSSDEPTITAHVYNEFVVYTPLSVGAIAGRYVLCEYEIPDRSIGDDGVLRIPLCARPNSSNLTGPMSCSKQSHGRAHLTGRWRGSKAAERIASRSQPR